MLRYLTLVVALSVPAAAQANSNASGSMRISLHVPEVCQIEASVVPLDKNEGTASGDVFEMCNGGRSFRVMAMHRALDEGETVRIDYGGESRQLSASGFSELAVRSGPVVRNVPISVRAQGLQQDLAISVGFAVI